MLCKLAARFEFVLEGRRKLFWKKEGDDVWRGRETDEEKDGSIRYGKKGRILVFSSVALCAYASEQHFVRACLSIFLEVVSALADRRH